MGWIDAMKEAVIGTAIVAAAITASPLCGPVGTLTAFGSGVSALIGASAAFVDEISDDDD